LAWKILGIHLEIRAVCATAKEGPKAEGRTEVVESFAGFGRMPYFDGMRAAGVLTTSLTNGLFDKSG
jgi:hypothetical protein